MPAELDPDVYLSGGSAAAEAQPKGKSVSYCMLSGPDKESSEAGEQLAIRVFDDGFYVIFTCCPDIEKN